MQQAPTPKEVSAIINISQENNNYSFHISSEEDILTFMITKDEKIFTRKLAFKEIKDTDSNPITFLNSSKEFIDYLKALGDMKKIILDVKPNIIMIIFEVDFVIKKHKFEIELLPEGKNLDSVGKELYRELNNKYENLKKEVEELKNKVNKLENLLHNINISKITLDNKSVIMNDDEFNMVHLALKSRLNKNVKELKKLYQATIDGDGAINFHSRCDNIPNTLVLVKTAGNRRFGGFTSEKWESDESGKYKDDKNAFLFSLDKQKIYSYKNDGKAIYCSKIYGPTFGCSFDFFIKAHGIQEKHLYTNESWSSASYNYNGDNNALSEDGKAGYIYAVEYEVFQVIFE